MFDNDVIQDEAINKKKNNLKTILVKFQKITRYYVTKKSFDVLSSIWVIWVNKDHTL